MFFWHIQKFPYKNILLRTGLHIKDVQLYLTEMMYSSVCVVMELRDQSKYFDFTEELEAAIKRDFGSLENLKAQLSAISVGVQGSGWGWLGYNKQAKHLQLAACANQDPLEATTGEDHVAS